MQLKDIEGVTGNVYGKNPVLGDGFLDGLPWYFRAKYDHWWFYVGHTANSDPLDGWEATDDAEGIPFGEPGKHEASWMSDEQAHACIVEGVRRWRARS